MNATLVVGFLTAVVTIVGCLVVHYLTRHREDRTRRIELSMRHLERQMEEFYGPIYSLIQLVWNVWLVKQEILENLTVTDNSMDINDVHGKIEEFIGRQFFFPIHEEIRSIMKSKLYLIEGAEMPQSFYNYLSHAIMQNVQLRLWTEAQISTDSVAGKPWDPQFAENIKSGFDDSMRRYQSLVEELGR